MIDAGLVPENLRNCVLTNEQIEQGLRYLQLEPRRRGRLWNDAWSTFTPAPDVWPTPPAQRRAGIATGSGGCSACRASAWLLALFVVPFYAMPAVAFGRVDPILRTPDPVWNPLSWDFAAMSNVLDRVFGGDLGGVFIRTVSYVVGRAGAVLPDRLPGCVLRGPPGRTAARAAARCCSCCRSGSAT